jgi:hypothetical protein
MSSPSLRRRRREGGRAKQRPGESARRCISVLTHPDYAKPLADPLFACGEKRAKKLISHNL